MCRRLSGAAGVLILACVLSPSGCLNTSGGGGSGHLDVNAGEDFGIELGESTRLQGSVCNRPSEVAFRWSQESGPEEVEIADLTSSVTRVGPFDELGDYKFRLLASTAGGAFGQDFVTITVVEDLAEYENTSTNDNTTTNENTDSDTFGSVPDRVRANVPDRIGVSESETLIASNPPEGYDADYVWAILAGDATISDDDARETSITVGADYGDVTAQVSMSVEVDGEVEVFQDTVDITIVPEDALRSRISGPTETSVGEQITLSASFSGVPVGGGVQHTWEVLEGDGEFVDETQREVEFTPRSTGDVVVQVTAQRAATTEIGPDEWKLVVYPATQVNLEIETENLQVLGEPLELLVTATNFADQDEVDFEWTVVSSDGDVEVTDADTPNPSVALDYLGTAELEITATTTVDDAVLEGQATVYVTSVSDLTPQVVIDVEDFGEIPIELDGEAAPITVANFLHYVDDSHYDGQIFHRVVADFVIQAGGFRVDGDSTETVDARDPIPNESENGLSNVRGTVSMALLTDQPESGTQGFFINLTDDNEFLDEAMHTVFGEVVDDGMDVVDQIASVEVDGEAPLENVVITSIRRVEESEDDTSGQMLDEDDGEPTVSSVD